MVSLRPELCHRRARDAITGVKVRQAGCAVA